MKIGSDSLRKAPNLTTKDNRETLSKKETKYLSALFNIIRKKENQKLIFAFLETVFSKIHKSPLFSCRNKYHTAMRKSISVAINLEKPP